MKYDYLVVGSGLYGAVFAHEAKKAGKRVLVVDRRPNIAGNVYTEQIEEINVHKYGAHIFHTNNKQVWEYVNQFAEFNRFTNSPVANYHGELYSLPFNMYTFNKMWGVVTPEEAEAKIKEQRNAAGIVEPKNLEEQAISLVGIDIYEKLFLLTNRVMLITDDESISGKEVVHISSSFISEEIAVLYQAIPYQYYAYKICLDLRVNANTKERKEFSNCLGIKLPGNKY